MITRLVAQPDLSSHGSKVQESDPGLPGLKPRAQQGRAPPGGSGGENPFICLFSFHMLPACSGSCLSASVFKGNDVASA